MRRSRDLALLILILTVMAVPAAQAQLNSPMIGWQAEFSDLFHSVSGTVTVLDEDTLQFDDFTYDGGGISVYFYLGSEDSTQAFSSGLPIGDQLVGTAYDGTQDAFTVDLPTGETLEGYNAISVWCVSVGVSFSSGTFMSPPVPEPSSAALLLPLALWFGTVRRDDHLRKQAANTRERSDSV